jgi:hypothetical protein
MNMKTLSRLFVASFVVSAAATSHGVIHGFKQLSVDLTNPTTAANGATWSEPDKLTVSKDGLGWDGEAANSRDGWIRTKPLALGLSWRPPSAVSVRVTIQPLPSEITLINGQKTAPYGGDVYDRYSPDRRNWSSWQALQRAELETPAEKKNPGRHFSATVRVPYRQRAEYGKRLSEYSTLDVPWKSDEEAAVRWILSRDPDFFAKQIPFIGSIEFLFEGNLYGGQRIRSLHAEISYGMSGLHLAPKDESVRKDRNSVPWRFKAQE